MPVNPYASMSLRVGDAEREQAASVVQEAYCDGRLDEMELDQRLGMVMIAQTRQDLSAALVGIPRTAPTASERPVPALSRPGTNALAGIAHLSGLFTWVMGPLLCYAVATPGTVGRKEAAKAFNYQAIAGILTAVAFVLAGVVLPKTLGLLLLGGGYVTYAMLGVVSAARAFGGQPFANPVTRIIRWEALDTSGR